VDQAVKRAWRYTFHLLPALRHAKHYTGIGDPEDLEDRMVTQQRGGADAARMLQVHKVAGGAWRLISVDWGTQDNETRGKYRGASRRCNICSCDICGAGQEPDAGPVWAYLLHFFPDDQGTEGQCPPGALHRIGFTDDEQAVLDATRDSGWEAARALGLPELPGGRWRLVTAELTAPACVHLAERDAVRRCAVCTPDRSRAGHAAVLAAIERGEVAERVHPRFGPAVRWHTRKGQPLTSSGRGGSLGRNVTATAAALVCKGLAEPAGGPGRGRERPYVITAAGQAALETARMGLRLPGRRADGLPVNRDGSLSRSRTSDEEKEAAGSMTSARKAEHTALRGLDRPRRAERLTGLLPADAWTLPGPAPAAQPAAAPARTGGAPPRFADPSWPAAASDGVAAGARQAASGPRRAPAAARRAPAPWQEAGRAAPRA